MTDSLTLLRRASMGILDSSIGYQGLKRSIGYQWLKQAGRKMVIRSSAALSGCATMHRQWLSGPYLYFRQSMFLPPRVKAETSRSRRTDRKSTRLNSSHANI